MSLAPDPRAFAVALAVAALATPVLARVARRSGWVDRRDEAERARKPRATPVPLVGGAALFLALGAAGVAVSGGPALPYASLAAALLVGTLDDLLGMCWWRKLLAQCAVAAVLVLEERARLGSPAAGAGLFLVAVVAQNALNTYDNADGAAASLSLLALWPTAAVAGALAGFLPFNLRPGRFGRPPTQRRAPVAYAGDGGSHLVGVLFAWSPAAWIFLTLPLLDLGRLVLVRVGRGQRPWVGDRSHLAHRLEARGLGPLAVVGVLCAIAAPPWLARAVLAEPLATWLGVAATALGFALAIALTPPTDSAGRAAGDAPARPAERVSESAQRVSQ